MREKMGEVVRGHIVKAHVRILDSRQIPSRDTLKPLKTLKQRYDMLRKFIVVVVFAGDCCRIAGELENMS